MASAVEALPDMAQLVGRYPRSVVLDRDDCLPSIADRGDVDTASGRRVLRGVREQVLDHPLDKEGIGFGRESVFDVEMHPVVTEQTREAVDDSVKQLSNVNVHRLDIEPSSLQPPEIEESGKHVVQGGGVRVLSRQQITALFLGQDMRAPLEGLPDPGD